MNISESLDKLADCKRTLANILTEKGIGTNSDIDLMEMVNLVSQISGEGGLTWIKF